MSYPSLPSVPRLRNIKKLSNVIDKFLNVKVNIDDLNNYTNYVLKNLFQFDKCELSIRICNIFYYGGFYWT